MLRYNGENSVVIRHEQEQRRLEEAEARDREAIDEDIDEELEAEHARAWAKMQARLKDENASNPAI